MPLALDYAPWANCHHRWRDETAFLGRQLKAGLHSIDAGCLPVDLLLVNPDRLQRQRVLPIFFSAAINSRRGLPGPFFSGSGIARSKGLAALCVADPSLAIDPTLTLCWYAGSQWQDTQGVLHRLLAGLCEQVGRELLLIGGSGAGFAALHLARKLAGKASALVWNPQTDLLRYYRAPVRAFLEHCFPSARPIPTQPTAEARLLRERGVTHSLLDALDAHPRRMLYLQNAGDKFHVERHAIPYIGSTGMRKEEDAYVARDGDGALWLGDWGGGHDPVPKPMLSGLIDHMLDPDRSVRECLQLVRSQGQIALRSSNEEARPLCVSVQLEGRCIRAKCEWNGSDSDQCEYAFYLMAGKERLQTRWYEAAAEARFELEEGETATHVVGFARTKAGDKVHASAVVPSALRIFVLGSCVSRDAFEFAPRSLAIAKYVARSSLAAAFADRPAPAHLQHVAQSLESRWQRQMVEIDLNKQLPSLLANVPFDLLLLDLIEERFAVTLFDGVPLTVSSEFARGYGSLEGLQLLNSADPARMALWMQGVRALVRQVGRDRIVLNRVYWASHDSQGRELPNAEKIAVHNGRLDVLYGRLERGFGVQSIGYPQHLLTADLEHKWGVAPYHFVSGMYLHTLTSLAEIAKRNEGSKRR